MKSLFRNSIYSVVKTLMTLLFPLVSYVYAARIFLADGMGQVDFSKSIANFFVLMASSGIANYATREAAKLRDDRKKLSKLTHELLIINLITSLFSYGLFLAVVFSVDKLFDYKLLLFINSITIFLNVIGMEWLYIAVEEFRYIAIRTAIIQLGCMVAMFISVRTKTDLWKYVAIQVIASSGNSLCNAFNVNKYISLKWIGGYEIKRHIRPLLAIFASWLFVQLFTHLDTVMLGFMTNDGVVGLYTAGQKISTMIATVITAASMALSPRISYYAEKHEIEKITELVSDAIKLILFLGIPAFFGLQGISKETLLLFSGKAFLQADLNTKIMASRIVLVPLNSMLVLHLFIPMRMEKNNIISTGTAALMNLVCNALLIPRLAQVGASIATVAAELLELVLNLLLLKDVIKIKDIKTSVVQFFFAALPIFVIVAVCKRTISVVLIRTVAIVLMSIGTYILLLISMHNTELKLVWSYVNNIRIKG